MSNNSGNSSQVISLPQGGGALKGIGETFSPDLFTGTGNFTVPIDIPPGRNDFQPDLNLVYSTGNGNSPFGLGWKLSIPGVSRKTSKGVPIYDDAEDTFILSGSEDLVPVEREVQTTRYRPRTEGLFSRIAHHQGNGLDYWEVRSKDGLVSFYGTRRKPEDAGDGWEDPAVIADPDDRPHIFSWKLTETRDPFGNRILYRYQRDISAHRAGMRQLPPWDQLYLQDIRYVDYQHEDDNEQFLVRVRFDYEDRPDGFFDCRAGFAIRTRRRCHRIVVTTHPDRRELARHYQIDQDDPNLKDNILVQEYEFSYHNQALNGASLLESLQVRGYDEATDAPPEEMPPLTFGYSRFTPENRDFNAVEGALPAASLSSPDLELVDLFGNGLPDILEMKETVRYWRNLGEGRFDRPRIMREAPAGLTLDDPGVQLLDANGDGRTDLLAMRNGTAGYYPLTFQGRWSRDSFQQYRAVPSFTPEDPEVQMVDIDGDGVTDAVRSGTRFEYFYNDPEEGWTETDQAARGSLDVFPDVNFSDRRVRWADISGDGLQDIVLVHDGNIEYWPNLGHGEWGPMVRMENSPRFPADYNPEHILLGDVDGDGAADLLFIDDNQVTLHMNRGGTGWSEPVTIKGTPSVSDRDSVRLVDLYGTGVSGVLWSAPASGQIRDQMYYLDFTGGRKPYLLDRMNNNRGAFTRVEYAPSTRFYRQDEADPENRWQTPLPFPVQVVARTEVIDRISGGKLTTEYRYHHGYWDGAEREFRGFGMVEQFDSERFDRYNGPGLHGDMPFQTVGDRTHFSPPTLKKTWFHQGPVGEEYGDWQELDRSDEYWTGDPQLLAHTGRVNAFLRTLPDRRTRRDALRCLRGRILRTELYALDDSDREDRPYTVKEHAYGLREEEPPPSSDQRQHIFFPHLLAKRTTRWDRGDDPRTRFQFTGEYDAYGQPRQQIRIACPRGWHAIGNPRSREYLTKLTETTFARRDDGERYLVDRTASTTKYEVTVGDNEPPLTVFELRDAMRGGDVAKNVIEQTLNHYDGDAFSGLPSGELGDFGALVCKETLVLTEAILREAYGDIPSYLDPEGDPDWSDDYHREFREQLPPLAGYTHHPAGDVREEGYFVNTTRRQYDFQTAGNEANESGQHGLVVSTRDALGNRTVIEHDRFHFLPVKVTNPAGLLSRADYDYRVFKPRLFTDANDNRKAFRFSPLGLLSGKAVMGKAGEAAGDSLEVPGTRFEYDFLAFTEGQPISVRTIRRIHHVNDTDVPAEERDETIETVEYSDGFGRLLQTRTQAEDVLFGVDDETVLPADPDIRPAEVAGQIRGPEVPPNVVVSGWQVYDNKGQVIEKYEPFFSTDWAYTPPLETELGQNTTIFYDPLGRTIRTVNPDGSEQREIYGVPHDLADPDRFAPTPWETYTYDANDNAGRSHREGSADYRRHWNTPGSSVLDALGRTIKTVERNGPDPATDWFTTRSAYDIRGNLLAATDALGRTVSRYIYNLAPVSDDEEAQPLRTEGLDEGTEQTVHDAAGNRVERRDQKGALVLQAYDSLQRPVRFWGRDNDAMALTLRQRLIYGDGSDSDLSGEEAETRNLRGQLYQNYDEAGLLTFERYDFKGNVLEKNRQIVADESILSVFPEEGDSPPEKWQIPPFRVDWQPPPGTDLTEHADTLLDSRTYRTSKTYDALDRLQALTYPKDTEGNRRVMQADYNRAGDLQRVSIDGDAFVRHIAYNARGQRILIARGNGIMTRYAYQPETFRMVRMYSETYNVPEDSPFTFRPNSPQSPLQDIGYIYDLAGNLLQLVEHTPGAGVQDNPQAAALSDPQLQSRVASGEALVRQFAYDPLYRLISATGRECRDIPQPRPWSDDPRCGFNSGNHATPNQDNAPALTRPYRETYSYDPAGNMSSLTHHNGENTWTRHFGIGGRTPDRWRDEWPDHLDGELWPEPPGNQLTHMGDDEPTAAQTHFYDDCGNLVRETTSRHFTRDHSDRLVAFRQQASDAEPSVHVQYLYDTGGQRVKKLVRKKGGHVETTTYIDGFFEEHRWQEEGQEKHNNRLHIMDDKKRIALVRVGVVHPEDKGPAVQYHLEDHLDSGSLVVDAKGSFVNREEYTPYGETIFGSFGRKRYRFTGKERDEESGLYYHGARYYAPWLSRWTSCDPAGTVDGLNLYWYVRGNPMRFVDPEGRETEQLGFFGRLSRSKIGKGIRTAGFLLGIYTAPESGHGSVGPAGTGTGAGVSVLDEKPEIRTSRGERIPLEPEPEGNQRPNTTTRPTRYASRSEQAQYLARERFSTQGSRGRPLSNPTNNNTVPNRSIRVSQLRQRAGEKLASGVSRGAQGGLRLVSHPAFGAVTAKNHGEAATAILLGYALYSQPALSGAAAVGVAGYETAKPDKISYPELRDDQSWAEDPNGLFGRQSGCNVCHESVRIDNWYKSSAEGRAWERLHGSAIHGGIPMDEARENYYENKEE